jgi:hypothetical protein
VPFPFIAYQNFVGAAGLIAQPDPSEMKQLMRQDARQLPRTPRQFLVQNDFAFSNKCRRVNWLAESPVGIKFASPGCQGW